MKKYESQCLLIQIETLRKKMIEVTVEKGFTSQESIELSQQLDRLLNDYEKNRDKYYQSIKS
ncbi:hypothetical protein GCM10011351_02410 [Paraliobacillus quinghaiensis]|uniref:Aspartyl-phosphate phosphatase Spo0E family protein n=1 Tax=Paraliobacillus quinghaiensis TaxID=470815 RepID=A0A917TE28_9BACI|nr:aspartyl-phosphate phosphatase Spo0E family protein [Paraliobacillus quinghaiensis]GGM20086.1 hypothetical protein GCM10011351_02410 [Paraliobacillus quinghaiensis]